MSRCTTRWGAVSSAGSGASGHRQARELREQRVREAHAHAARERGVERREQQLGLPTAEACPIQRHLGRREEPPVCAVAAALAALAAPSLLLPQLDPER